MPFPIRRSVSALALLAPLLGFPAATSAAVNVPVRGTVAIANSTMDGACVGGGRVVLHVDADATGFDVTVVTRGLEPGARWRGDISVKAEGFPTDRVEFRRPVADDGTWSVTRRLESAGGNPSFSTAAFEVGASRLCSVVLQPQRPLAASAVCPRLLRLELEASRKADDSTAVRWIVRKAKPASRWTITVDAAVKGEALSTQSRHRPKPNGVIRGRTSFDLVEPVLTLTARADGGLTCRMRVERELSAG